MSFINGFWGIRVRVEAQSPAWKNKREFVAFDQHLFHNGTKEDALMDRYSDMAIFIAVIDAGGFSPAARKLKMTHSAMSKRVQRLEDRLGTQLLLRTTRTMTLTQAGERYVQSARPILADIQALEAAVMHDADAPRGILKVSAPNALGQHHVVPALIDFMRRYPEIKIDLTLTDAIIDIRHAGIDVAIRSGELSDPSLVAHKLSANERLVCASPAYLDAHGVPGEPGELAGHSCLKLNFESRFNDWEFRAPNSRAIPIAGDFTCNSLDAIRTLCLAGMGIARLPKYMVNGDIQAGRLIPLLQAFSSPATSAIYALRAAGDYVPARTRVFIAFLTERLSAACLND
ncbi:LysR family transcriptional regulator [Pseudomonas fluorescens]|uniref:LysR family transcriptional regulator n=1 Tax=Pseudomonas fluorescens TaxID=294 RepID=UPI002ACA39A1|nr:LysR family transcriptional regulator [Pseudomonas fluorescens]MDZ5434842.1 LysR family transcriptional regulator [Pseudomonas fluorescens]